MNVAQVLTRAAEHRPHDTSFLNDGVVNQVSDPKTPESLVSNPD